MRARATMTSANGNDRLSNEEILDRIENLTRTAQGWQGMCPLHESKSGLNLSITEQDGKLLMHCFAQECRFEDILAALKGKVYTRAQVYRGRVFEYKDLSGDVVAVHKHKGPWFRPSGDKFIAEEPARRPMYNFPEVVEAVKQRQPVYGLEGEKDCETALALGAVATTSGGANTWGRVAPYVSSLSGADMRVIGDNDEAGDGYVRAVLSSVVEVARSVKLLKLTDLMPDLREGGDLTDYIEAGGSWDEVMDAFDRITPITSVTSDTFDTSITPMSVADLMERQLPDISWTVEDVLPEGVALLAGKPKKGKSWLALGLCIAVPEGSPALGCKEVARGKSLYLALEDNERRMQRRLRKMLQGRAAPKNMYYHTKWPRLDEGGAEQLNQWLNNNPETKLVVIDTLAKVRKPARGQAIYQEDYAALEALLPIAAEHQISILVVHHLRQLPGPDPQDEISGSSGLTGGVDGWMILRRTPGSNGPTLLVDGRDIEITEEYAIEWNQDTAGWSIAGVAEQVHMSDTRRQILNILKHGKTMTPKEVSDLLPELKYDNVKGVMRNMLEADQLIKDDKGRYKAAAGPEHDTSGNGGNEADEDVTSEEAHTNAENEASGNRGSEGNGYNPNPVTPDEDDEIIEGAL